MKRILLSVVVFLFAISSMARAQSPFLPFLAISPNHQNIEEGMNVYLYAPFSTYVLAFPGEDGLICADFKMDVPDWIINMGTVFNADVILQIDQDYPYDEDGARICLSSCAWDRWEPVWLCKVSHLPTAAGLTGDMWIVPRPSIGQLQATTCLEGNPSGPLEAPCPLNLNYIWGCWLANETFTWGAIKSIYTE